MSETTRLVLYHKQQTSARVRFLRQAAGNVCAPTGVPEGARARVGSCARTRSGESGAALLTHPAMLLREAERSLALPRGALEPDTGLACQLAADDGFCADVVLGRFTTIDPPFSKAEAVGAGFIDLTQARGLPAAELSLLRLVYEHLLG